MKYNGTVLGAWVSLHDDCTIDYDVCGPEVELAFGGRHGFEMVTGEHGLEKLIATASDALTALRAEQAGT